MKYLSVCSGIEAATAAWHQLGWKPVAFAEIEPSACFVLHHHYGASRPRFMPDPDEIELDAKDISERRAAIKAVAALPEVGTIPNVGDFTNIQGDEYGAIDALVGGTPCFPGGTLIATACGFVEIQDVCVGDKVLTHTGQYQTVLHIGSKMADTVRVIGQGHHGFVTTANHPFLARKKSGKTIRIQGKSVRIPSVSEPKWIPAENLAGHHWACVADWPERVCPSIEIVGNESSVPEIDKNLFLLVGAYLGDGWARVGSRRGYVKFGINAAKLERLRAALDSYGTWSSHEEKTSTKVQLSSRALARWMSSNFGSGAEHKHVPMWVLGLPSEYRDAIIDGYMITDGCASKTSGMKSTTVSRRLALTMRSLAISCGYASSVYFTKRPETCVIEGRTVNQADTYMVTFSPFTRSSFYENGFRWQAVRKVELTGLRERVYDLEVEEDHSYVADGIAVHNCQDFSIAGLRAGMDGKRGQLTVEFARLAHRLATKAGTRWLAWENVPGVLSIDDGWAFAEFLSILTKRSIRVPDGGWSNSGIVPGAEDGFGLAWRVLDAQHLGIPQRRRRVFIVGYFGDWRRAAAVFLERHSLSGHPPPSREKREVAPTIPARRLGGGGLGTNFDCDGGLVESRRQWPVEVAPTLGAEYGKKWGLDDQHIGGGRSVRQSPASGAREPEDRAATNARTSSRSGRFL